MERISSLAECSSSDLIFLLKNHRTFDNNKTNEFKLSIIEYIKLHQINGAQLLEIPREKFSQNLIEFINGNKAIHESASAVWNGFKNFQFPTNTNINEHQSQRDMEYLEFQQQLKQQISECPKVFSIHNILQWKSFQVIHWLDQMGLPQYSRSLFQENVDGHMMLTTINVDILRNDYKMKHVHSEKIMKEIDIIKKNTDHSMFGQTLQDFTINVVILVSERVAKGAKSVNIVSHSSEQNNISMYINASGFLVFAWNDDIRITGVSNVRDGHKHFVSVVRNTETDMTSLYVDGIKEKSIKLAILSLLV